MGNLVHHLVAIVNYLVVKKLTNRIKKLITILLSH